MVNTIFQTNIFTCNISDRIDSVLAVMREMSYSQVPVYNNGEFLGLLTTNTISRWLAEQLNTIGIVDNENTIDKVMKYEEFSDNYKFIDRHKNLFDVTELFRNHLRYTSKLDAVLITETGNINQRILAIITWYDLPNIYRIMLD